MRRRVHRNGDTPHRHAPLSLAFARVEPPANKRSSCSGVVIAPPLPPTLRRARARSADDGVRRDVDDSRERTGLCNHRRCTTRTLTHNKQPSTPEHVTPHQETSQVCRYALRRQHLPTIPRHTNRYHCRCQNSRRRRRRCCHHSWVNGEHQDISCRVLRRIRRRHSETYNGHQENCRTSRRGADWDSATKTSI